MKIIRNNFTLMETLVALTLLSVVLTTVFGFFRELSWWNTQNEIEEKNDLQMRYLESKLQWIFSNTVHESDSRRKFYFYTIPADQGVSKATSLVFTFDNGVHYNPIYSGDVLGRLYLDDQNRLCLAIWPLYSENPQQMMIKEVLSENVRQLSFRFFCPPSKVPHPIDPQKKIPESDKWHEDEWLLSYSRLPVIVELNMILEKKEKKKSSKEWTSAFVLPAKHYPLLLPR